MREVDGVEFEVVLEGLVKGEGVWMGELEVELCMEKGDEVMEEVGEM